MRRPILTMVIFAFVFALYGAVMFGQEDAYPYKRSELRISAYAPPTIPHEIDELACMECHATNEVGAPMIPHKEIINCRQCHVPTSDAPLFRKNKFVGMSEPDRLPRAYKGAPPLVPHRLSMRENCLACHGEDSRPDVVNTSHPTRSNCRQCHVGIDRGVQLFRRNLWMADPVGERRSP
jgi:nitrate reductase cytochrome c-type subunit